MNRYTNKIILTVVLLFGTVMILGLHADQVKAQIPETNTNSTLFAPPSSNLTGIAVPHSNRNWTGTVEINPTIIEALKSKIGADLSEATANAVMETGPNSTALAAFMKPTNGFLVYNVIVADANNNIKKVTVDAGNGQVLANEQISSRDMRDFALLSDRCDILGRLPGGGCRPSDFVLGQ
jgi:hypothetical protein